MISWYDHFWFSLGNVADQLIPMSSSIVCSNNAKPCIIIDQVQGQDNWILAMFSFCVFVLFLHLCFYHFLVPFPQSNQRKSFYFHGKYFAKENVFLPIRQRTEFTASCPLVELSIIIRRTTVRRATEGTIFSVIKIGQSNYIHLYPKPLYTTW